MKRPVFISLLGFTILILCITACVRPAPRAAPLPSATATPLPTPPLLPTPMPSNTARPQQVEGPRALVDKFAEAWAHGRSEDVVALFAEKLEYQMGPNYITDKGTLWWFTVYWKAIDGKLPVTHCDPEVGNTIRCDLEFTSGCSPYIKLKPIHFDTTFTVRQGKIEKLIATMSPEEFQELTTILQGMYAWTSANMPTELAEAKKSGDPRLSARIELKGCIEYAKAATLTPAVTP